MSATGLRVFDETVQKTNIWLNEVMEDLGPDRQRAYHALQAVLRALRDRLTVEEAAHLGSQLPMLVRGVYYGSYRPARQPTRDRKAEDFLGHIAAGLHDIAPIDPEDAAKSVFKVLNHHVDPGEVRQVRQMLPEDVRRLWPQ